LEGAGLLSAVKCGRGGSRFCERGRFGEEGRIELNAEAIERARKLVGQAKEHQKRKKRKLSDKS